MQIDSADIRERLTTDGACSALDRLAPLEPIRWTLQICEEYSVLSTNLETKDGKILSGNAVRLSHLLGSSLDDLVQIFEKDLVRSVGEGTLDRRVVSAASGPGRREFTYSWRERRWEQVSMPSSEETERREGKNELG